MANHAGPGSALQNVALIKEMSGLKPVDFRTGGAARFSKPPVLLTNAGGL